jgi:hypothetical protein
MRRMHADRFCHTDQAYLLQEMFVNEIKQAPRAVAAILVGMQFSGGLHHKAGGPARLRPASNHFDEVAVQNKRDTRVLVGMERKFQVGRMRRFRQNKTTRFNAADGFAEGNGAEIVFHS